jgi:hypothetical protein
MSDLQTRIAAVASGELRRQQHAIDPYRVWQLFDMNAVADAVIRELGLKRADGPLRGTPVHRYITDWIPNG